MSTAIATKIKNDTDVCENAFKFINLYNETADLLRSRLNLLYSSFDPCLIYNGNIIKGIDEIMNFWKAIKKTKHELVNFYKINYISL